MAKKRFFIENELVFAEKPENVQFQDLEGKEFGRLTVIGFAGREGRRTYWFCKCRCKILIRVWASSLKNGATNSCGCFMKDRIRETQTKHGQSLKGRVSKMYMTWQNMIRRCQSPSVPNFKDYGGRGITVCKRWQKFENFLEDMGERPKGKTLDRKNVNGNYEKSNCRWATQKEQQNNRSNNRILTYNDKSQTLAQWADETRIKAETIAKRIKNGWSVDQSLTKSVRVKT